MLGPRDNSIMAVLSHLNITNVFCVCITSTRKQPIHQIFQENVLFFTLLTYDC